MAILGKYCIVNCNSVHTNYLLHSFWNFRMLLSGRLVQQAIFSTISSYANGVRNDSELYNSVHLFGVNTLKYVICVMHKNWKFISPCLENWIWWFEKKKFLKSLYSTAVRLDNTAILHISVLKIFFFCPDKNHLPISSVHVNQVHMTGPCDMAKREGGRTCARARVLRWRPQVGQCLHWCCSSDGAGTCPTRATAPASRTAYWWRHRCPSWTQGEQQGHASTNITPSTPLPYQGFPYCSPHDSPSHLLLFYTQHPAQSRGLEPMASQ